MKKQTCNCHPDSPFHWAYNRQPSIFAQDIAFRPKKPQVYETLSLAENVIAYKQFSIHTRAHPSIKPNLNKHELGGRKK
jgi:hypothetical protein